MADDAPFLFGAFGERAFSEVTVEEEAAAPTVIDQSWATVPARKLALTAAVVATTILTWTPPVPAVAADTYGFSNQTHRYSPAQRSTALLGQVVWAPQVPTEAAAYTYVADNKLHLYSPAKRSIALLGQIAAKPAQPPEPPPKGWASAFSQPSKRFTRVIHQTGGFYRIGEAVEVTTYQEGWRSQFSTPPKPALRSIALLGSVAWPPQVPLVEPVYSYVADNKRHVYSPAKRSVELLGGSVWPAQVPTTEAAAATYGFANQHHRYEPVKRSVALLGQISTWPAQTPTVVQVVYEDGWRNKWQEPPKLARRPVLLGQVVWHAQPPIVEFGAWRSKFSEPPKRSPRSIGLLGETVWPPQVPAVVQQVDYVADNKLHRYSPAKRSVNLLGGPVWPAQVPTVEVVITYGFQNSVSKWPYEYVQARRSRDWLGPSVSWVPQIVAPSPPEPPRGGHWPPEGWHDHQQDRYEQDQRKEEDRRKKIRKKAREIEETIAEAYDKAVGKPRLKKAIISIEAPDVYTPETIIEIGQELVRRLALVLDGTGRRFAADRRRMEQLERDILELQLLLPAVQAEEDELAALLVLTTVM